MESAAALAQVQINSDTVTPGVLGFIVIAAIAAVLYFLMKSMRTKLATVRATDYGDGPQTAPATADPDGAAK
ncbi:hypothetical protein [Nocardiopsis coralliicola]